MREILFRGKRTDDGNWIFGSIVHQTDCYGDKCDRWFILEGNHTNVYNIDYPIEVQKETVGQFTGLFDKNGKRIFEGDIVECLKDLNGNWIDKHIEIGYVEMMHGAFGLHRKQGYYRPFKDWLEDYEYEIIGSIHDNTELLEVTE